jgi:Transposase
MESGVHAVDAGRAELRMTWEALASITVADATADADRLDGLRRIGIDEKSWGKGAGKYLVIVSEYDAGIHPVAAELAPRAEICLDAFHVVKWAGDKLDELRLAGELRAAGREDKAATLGAGMWALRNDYPQAHSRPARRPRQHRSGGQAAVQGLPAQRADLRGTHGQRRYGQDADALRDRLDAPLPHPRDDQPGPHLIPLQGLHRGEPARRLLERPRRSPQRPDHTRPWVPPRHCPDEHDHLRIRQPLPESPYE